MTKQIKLITSKFSPYGHRVEMLLIEKEISYQKQEVDLSSKPEWFVKDAPLGKVPLLYVGEKPLFESIPICEYLEEHFPEKPLHPKSHYTKSCHRAWMEFSSVILSGIFGLIFAQNQKELSEKKSEIILKLAILEKNLKFSPYFDGEKFSLVDICMACSFRPLTFIDDKFALGIFDSHQNLASYVESIINRGSLQKVLPNNYNELFDSFLSRRKSYLLNLQGSNK